jgi:hypothetical protein
MRRPCLAAFSWRYYGDEGGERGAVTLAPGDGRPSRLCPGREVQLPTRHFSTIIIVSADAKPQLRAIFGPPSLAGGEGGGWLPSGQADASGRVGVAGGRGPKPCGANGQDTPDVCDDRRRIYRCLAVDGGVVRGRRAGRGTVGMPLWPVGLLAAGPACSGEGDYKRQKSRCVEAVGAGRQETVHDVVIYALWNLA